MLKAGLVQRLYRLPRPSLRKLTMSTMKLNNTMEEYSAKDQRVYAPAAGRNKQHILDVLARHLSPASGPSFKSAIEVACGTGEHTAHFAAALPDIFFQPTDMTTELFESIAAHSLGLSNVAAPKLLNVSRPEDWEAVAGGRVTDAVLCSNMTHISPFSATLGLLEGAGRHLSKEGLLFIYGPFTVEGGKHTTESNQAFDTSLRRQNPEWGYRDIEDIKARAGTRGLKVEDVVSMPANNFLLIFRKL